MAERVIDFLFVFGKRDCRKHAGFIGRRRAITGGEQIFELAQDVFCAFAKFGAFFDQFMAAFAAR